MYHRRRPPLTGTRWRIAALLTALLLPLAALTALAKPAQAAGACWAASSGRCPATLPTAGS
ncbi:hypothetical protein AB0P07_34240 [Streptomyces sp. NPDC085944]|uniref:hypothetical protein n=1 Tax=Streptomyces sp. NPDC085944 TaxID=3154962 RepID=UPI003443335E